MKFGPVAVDNSFGAILAHSTTVGKKRLKKGTLIGDDEQKTLSAAGISSVIAAQLEPGDLLENEAAEMLAASFSSDQLSNREPFTGRVNLYAKSNGILVVDTEQINAMNSVDSSLTIATLDQHSAVRRGQMVATVKIIPFAVPGHLVEKAASLIGPKTLHVHEFKSHRVGLVQSTLPSVKESILDKTRLVTDARLTRSGSKIVSERRCDHVSADIQAAIVALVADCDAILVFGASAVADNDDVIPDAIRKAGGRVLRFGMPVDPGNLLVLGDLNGMPVVGAPGCARSPKENGFDWVLDRLFAGISVSSVDIAGMGVGGLLKEMSGRPEPREQQNAPPETSVHAVILAAGQSKRAGQTNKLLAEFNGIPLIRRVYDVIAKSDAQDTTVVTGHEAERIRDALAGTDCTFVHNPDYAKGMSASLKAGIHSIAKDVDGALIMLGDMPNVTAEAVNRLIEIFDASGRRAVVRATSNGKPGNPVVIPNTLFGQIELISGDTGARHLIEASDVEVINVEVGEGALFDLDTSEAIIKSGGKLL